MCLKYLPQRKSRAERTSFHGETVFLHLNGRFVRFPCQNFRSRSFILRRFEYVLHCQAVCKQRPVVSQLDATEQLTYL